MYLVEDDTAPYFAVQIATEDVIIPRLVLHSLVDTNDVRQDRRTLEIEILLVRPVVPLWAILWLGRVAVPRVQLLLFARETNPSLQEAANRSANST